MEFYAAVRRSVYVEGLSERPAARRFGLARETVRKMLRDRVSSGETDPVSETGRLHRGHRSNPHRRSAAPEETTAHGQAHLGALMRRARLHGRLHDCQRLRAQAEAGRARDVRAARASAGRRPGRLRRSPGGHRRRRMQGALLGRAAGWSNFPPPLWSSFGPPLTRGLLPSRFSRTSTVPLTFCRRVAMRLAALTLNASNGSPVSQVEPVSLDALHGSPRRRRHRAVGRQPGRCVLITPSPSIGDVPPEFKAQYYAQAAVD